MAVGGPGFSSSGAMHRMDETDVLTVCSQPRRLTEREPLAGPLALPRGWPIRDGPAGGRGRPTWIEVIGEEEFTTREARTRSGGNVIERVQQQELTDRRHGMQRNEASAYKRIRQQQQQEAKIDLTEKVWGPASVLPSDRTPVRFSDAFDSLSPQIRHVRLDLINRPLPQQPRLCSCCCCCCVR